MLAFDSRSQGIEERPSWGIPTIAMMPTRYLRWVHARAVARERAWWALGACVLASALLWAC